MRFIDKFSSLTQNLQNHQPASTCHSESGYLSLAPESLISPERSAAATPATRVTNKTALSHLKVKPENCPCLRKTILSRNPIFFVVSMFDFRV